MAKKVLLDFDEFLDVNYDELSAYFSETGATMELDFDFDRQAEDIWDSYSFTYPQFKYTKESK